MKHQGRSMTKRTGGRIKPARNKKRYEQGREASETTVGEPRFQTIDSRGNATKTRALSTNVAQISDGAETVHGEIIGVEDNPANVNYKRRNIITKGAIITVEVDGEEKEARVTSRPGQDGQVNAVFE
ncbi:30S ribosomal protein S8e [Salinigranum halophilum]|uniref:30S ribosomal protein S8e n=1 Tax=Salinigranum halophilum TaxID=2565931 RepID=UPI0010A83BB8|nr:30S ribosomal protein S8e [Salinigranum halophilum]